MSKLDTNIKTIPGVGNVIGAVILGEIGDIERFDNPSKLVAYAGLDLPISQSGEYEASSGKLSKRGSPYLRKALYMAAQRAEFCDPVSTLIMKKRNEGNTILSQQMLLPKLCHTIYAILKEDIPYEIQ